MNVQDISRARGDAEAECTKYLADWHRRDFLAAMGASGAIALSTHPAFSSLMAATPSRRSKDPALIYGAFIYPPTEKLRAEGYFSWPGSSFDAEGRQRAYAADLQKAERELGIRLCFSDPPMDTSQQVNRFIRKVKDNHPDGLMLLVFKKGHWSHVTHIIDETDVPTVVLAPLGVLLVPQVRQVNSMPGVFVINSLENLDAMAYGLKMIRTAKCLRQSLIVNIEDEARDDYMVPHLGTTVRTVPRQRFVDEFNQLRDSEEAERRAHHYRTECRDIVEPSRADILDAAKTYFVLKRIIEQEEADAMMMECLPGLKKPRVHVPPCMGFMDLRDEGIPAGCEADLDATLTMMLVQQLFDLPSFQHNPSVDTERELYFGAHCTCATRMDGPDRSAAPYILRSHAEAGWGCVPEVVLRGGQTITLAKYLVDEKQPRMILYTGRIVESPCQGHVGGCRTNMITTINELDDISQLQGHHLSMWYGDWGDRMKAFNQLMKVETVA